MTSTNVIGVDFTSAPSRCKPITVAHASLRGTVVELQRVDALTTFESFEFLLRDPVPWIGGFDLPLGLPRELVTTLAWPTDWAALINHVASLSRASLRGTFKAFCDVRPVGNKFAHRRCDGPAGASPSMKWVNPPVAYMLHAGAPRLLASGAYLPGLHQGDPTRVALEAYPGYTARQVTRASYKSDDKRKHDEPRRQARELIVAALAEGIAGLCVRLNAPPALLQALIDDGSADLLDAVICAMQAAHASRLPRYGWPLNVDPIEGWIAAVPEAATEAATEAALRPH